MSIESLLGNFNEPVAHFLPGDVLADCRDMTFLLRADLNDRPAEVIPLFGRITIDATGVAPDNEIV